MGTGRYDDQEKDFSEIKIKLIPRSSREEIIGREGDVYKVKVTSPPVNGKANTALISLLARRLGRPKGSIEIKTGRNSRQKLIRIYGITKEGISRLLD